MEQSPSWEANWSAASQEIPRILWNPKVHHRTHQRTPPVPILSFSVDVPARCVMPPLETPPPPPEIRVGEYFISGLFCLQRKHLAYVFRNKGSLRRGVVSISPKPQAGGPPLVGCPRLLIQYIRSYSPNWRPFLHPQPEDAPCRGDRDPLIMAVIATLSILLIIIYFNYYDFIN